MKFKDVVNNAPEIMTGLLVISTSIIVFIEIIFRYFLSFSLGWSSELAKNFFVWMSFLGAAVCIKRGMHFSFPLFIHRIPLKTRRFIEIFTNILIILFVVILLVSGVESFQQSLRQTFIALDISYGWLFSVIPISAILMIIYLVQKIIKIIRTSGDNKFQSGG